MSEQELNKWVNKFKLWCTLHPNEWDCYYCGKCKHQRSRMGDCGKQKSGLMLTNNGKVIYTPLSGNSYFKFISCVEWIKYE